MHLLNLLSYSYTPFIIYATLAITIVVVMLVVSHFLGERHKEKKTDETFEAGMPITGSAHTRFPQHYYLVAMFFVVFDLDAVFIISYAISFKELGWPGYIGILIFIMLLLAIIVYEIKTGALDFGPKGKKILAFKNKKA